MYIPVSLSPQLSLLTLDRQSLSLILQHLPWRDKLLQLTHLCRSLPPLQPVDFRYDQLFSHEMHWRYCNWDHVLSGQRLQDSCSSRLSTFCASPRLQQLFSHVRRLHVRLDDSLPKRLLPVLCSPSPTALSPYCRLRHLHLLMWQGASRSLFERLTRRQLPFPQSSCWKCTFEGRWDQDR